MLEQVSTGTNNLTYLVGTPGGPYFLRVYRNTDDPARIRYEHALLAALQHAGLPFAVPAPLATDRGETYIEVEDGEKHAIAALFPAIAGVHPRLGDIAQAAVCGEALAALDLALARTEVDPSLPRLGTYGDLPRVHPLVPDPVRMVEELPAPPRERSLLHSFLEDLLASIPDLYVRLPRQVIHSDFSRGNALVVEDRVSGVLDFEVASPDIRAMDLAVGLWSFGLAARRSRNLWSLVEAFARGYGRLTAPTPGEIDALPILLRLREATSLVHWFGRFRQGLATEAGIAERETATLSLDDWLHVHGEELIRRVEDAAR